MTLLKRRKCGCNSSSSTARPRSEFWTSRDGLQCEADLCKRGCREIPSRENRCLGADPEVRSPGKPLRAVFIRSYLLFGHSVLLGRYFNEDTNKLMINPYELKRSKSSPTPRNRRLEPRRDEGRSDRKGRFRG
jgi:hypothetical protein